MSDELFLTQDRDKINNALTKLLTGLKPENMYGPMLYSVQIGGKRLRPILSEIVYRAAKGTLQGPLCTSLAVELLHTFTLVHDDIMDNDSLRRGNPTVHTKWDIATGVLAGDGLISLAYRVLRLDKFNKADQILHIFTEGVIEVCEGQGLDKDFETQNEVSEELYLDMINKKTAALLAVPAQIGAACADADDSFIQIIGDYARALGLAFQIQDDLLDIISTEATLGKNIGSDIRAGKKTFLYVKALELITNKEDRELYISILNKRGCLDSEVERVHQLYQQYGVIDATKLESERRINQAEELLKKISDKYDITELQKFNNYLLHRTY